MKMGLTVTEANMMYIKQEMRAILGDKPQALLNCLSVVLYKEDTPLEELLKSLDVIQADIRLRIELAKRDSEKNMANMANMANGNVESGKDTKA